MKTLKIGLSCSPSKRISSDNFKATEILISYGGGMGGANKTFYVINKNGNQYTLISGEVIILNPNFIVMERQVELVEQVIDTTAHSNYSTKTCEQSILTEYYKLEYRQDYALVNEYINNDNIIVYKDVNIIY